MAVLAEAWTFPLHSRPIKIILLVDYESAYSYLVYWLYLGVECSSFPFATLLVDRRSIDHDADLYVLQLVKK